MTTPQPDPRPVQSTGRHQRSIYKLLDRLLSQDFGTPVDLLASLVRDIVDSDRLVMTGGRVWELDPTADAYVLRHQYGEMEFLHEGTVRTTQEMPAVAQLALQRTLVATAPEEDERGKRVYSLTGVGDIVSRPTGKLYPYALAFTARDHSDEFLDTMVVIGSAATTAIRNLHAAQRERRMRHDLDQAWEIQRGLVPEHTTTYRDYEVYGVSVPDAVVGGDYFDYLRPSFQDDDRLSIVISDAASKGLPAAVQALFVSGALRMGVSFNTKMSSLIGRLNGLIYDTFPLERFVTLFYCELTPSANGLVLYANAGHCPPIHYRAATGDTDVLLPTGGILGIVEEQPFGVENINMQAGDILVAYTDGITEAQDRHGQQYGEERLRTFITDHRSASAEHLAQLLLGDVQQFAAGARYSDDRTIVVIKRRASVASD